MIIMLIQQLLVLPLVVWMELVRTRTRITSTAATITTTTSSTTTRTKCRTTTNSSNTKTTTKTSSTIKIKTRTTINTALTTRNPIHTNQSPSPLSQLSVKMLAGIVINLPLNSAKRRVWSRTAAAVTQAEMSV